MAIPNQGVYQIAYNNLDELLAKLNNTRADLGARGDTNGVLKLDETINKLRTQQATLADNYGQLYSQALTAGQENIANIEVQTKNRLAGTAIEELRQRGYGAGQASARGSTPNLEAKVADDVASKAMQDKLNILDEQGKLQQGAIGIQQQILQNAAESLERRRQFGIEQDLKERTFAAQLAASKAGGGGGGGGSNLLGDALNALTKKVDALGNPVDNKPADSSNWIQDFAGNWIIKPLAVVGTTYLTYKGFKNWGPKVLAAAKNVFKFIK